MIRAVLRRRWADKISGASTDQLFTLDFDCPELEEALLKGGYGESGFDMTDLVGVEVLPKVEEVTE